MMNEEIPNLTAFDQAALDQAFAAVEQQARNDAAALDSPEAVEAFRLRWLGRKQGLLNEVSSRWLKAAPPINSSRQTSYIVKPSGRRWQ